MLEGRVLFLSSTHTLNLLCDRGYLIPTFLKFLITLRYCLCFHSLATILWGIMGTRADCICILSASNDVSVMWCFFIWNIISNSNWHRDSTRSGVLFPTATSSKWKFIRTVSHLCAYPCWRTKQNSGWSWMNGDEGNLGQKYTHPCAALKTTAMRDDNSWWSFKLTLRWLLYYLIEMCYGIIVASIAVAN